jgi:hypothetical protein
MSVPAVMAPTVLEECVQQHCANLCGIARVEMIAEHQGNPKEYKDYYCELVALARK